MNEESSPPIARGQRSPTAVWIQSRGGKGGTSYAIRWTDPISRKVKSQSCGRDKALARTMRTKKSADLREGLSGRLPTKTLGDLIEAMNRFMVGKSPHTIRTTSTSLAELKALCGNRLLEHVGREMLMDFRAKRLHAGVAVATVNKDHRQIRSALSYAADAGWLRFNPLLRWKQGMLRETEKLVRVVEPDEFSKLLNKEACPDPTFRVLMIVAYYQGLRRTELANLRWQWINLERGIMRIVNMPEAGEFTKSRKNRTLPMDPIVRHELSAMRKTVPTVVDSGRAVPKYPHVFTWPAGQPFKPDWITHQFERIVKRSGVGHCSIHDLRRSFSTLAQRAGVDRMTVKDLGGWSSVTVVEKHYTGEIQPALERAMERVAQARGAAG